MIKVIIHGCNGKMGQVVAQLIEEDAGLQVVAGIDRENRMAHPFPVYTSCEGCRAEADVIIDFSSSQITNRLLDYAVNRGLPVVLCTTGHSEDQLNKIRLSSERIPILMSANMSLGVNILANMLRKITGVLADSGFDIEIVEKHHNQKVDAPSGTALLFANTMNEVLDNSYGYNYSRHEDRKKREIKEIGMHSVRGGTIVGEHSIIFAGKDEVIEITHTAYSRAIFAKGALAAARYLAGQTRGLYNMDDVIGRK